MNKSGYPVSIEIMFIVDYYAYHTVQVLKFSVRAGSSLLNTLKP